MPDSVSLAPGAIEFTYAHGGGVEYCTLRSLGIHGITINEGCDGQRIYGNRFFGLGAGGVKVGGGEYGCDKEDETFDVTISQNKIENCGRRFAGTCDGI